MNMKTGFDSSMLRKNSLLFWCTLVVPVGIIVIGINFILNPVGAATGYRHSHPRPRRLSLHVDQGHRDIFSGLVVLSCLWNGDRRTTATLYALSIFVPFGDGLVILATSGLCAPYLYSLGTTLLHDDRLPLFPL